MKSNLFSFGTGELTHDAILAWILDWGNHTKSPLHKLSKDFVYLLTGDEFEINKVDISLEKYNIDILAVINDEIVIVIEDKIDTYARTGQLEKYKKVIDEKYKDKKKFYSYITVGDEPNYDNILKNDYKVIERKELLSLVSKYKKDNEILEDYSAYLSEIEEEFTSYKNEDLSKWKFRGWEGFFKEELNKKFKDGGWSYVPNQRGGFQAFYWNFKEYSYQDKTSYTTYIQVEGHTRDRTKDKIAFKVKVEDKSYRSEIRNYLWNNLKNKIDEISLVQKPKRFGHGLTMTYAEINKFQTKKELSDILELVVAANQKISE